MMGLTADIPPGVFKVQYGCNARTFNMMLGKPCGKDRH